MITHTRANVRYFTKCLVLLACAVCILFPASGNTQDVHTESALNAQRIAPGEALPLRVRLANFGNQSKTDVSVTFRVVNAYGDLVALEEETIAIETTASIIRNITLPHNVPTGTYTVQVDVRYPGQQAPAQSSYQFRIEKQIVGIFVSDALKYSLIVLLALLASVLAFRHFRRIQTASHYDYSNIPPHERIYYEIIGEIIHEMRLHDGDRVFTLVQKIPGLTVSAGGRVERIPGNPTGAVATLVKEYERCFGKHANFALGTRTGRRLIKNTLS